MFRLLFLGCLLLMAGLWFWLVADGTKTEADPTGSIWFQESAQALGLDFRHFNGMSGELYFCEILGSGAAFFDYDNDGDLDVYLVQGAKLESVQAGYSSIFPTPQGGEPQDRLFRNDLRVLPDGTRHLHFTDITESSGLQAGGYGMGVATGDIDNDGFVDLYVTNFGSNQLWHNQGDGTFRDISEASGTEDERWSTSAAFVDYDRDGWLDLYVANYVDYRLRSHSACQAKDGSPDYCGPTNYPHQTDRLFRNLGSGVFQDVTSQAGLLQPSSGLGVVVSDVNADGWPDIYVANDQAFNFLWMNQKDGRFEEEALLRGCAIDSRGRPQASMGIDAADVDRDGDEDLFMTHLMGEANALYLNDGKGYFRDESSRRGLARASVPWTGFGTAFLDVTNNGWQDVVVVNGAVLTDRRQLSEREPFPLLQPNQLYLNEGGQFIEGSDRAPALQNRRVSRGLTTGDIDNDGDLDVLIQNNSGPVELLLNTSETGNSWLGLRLQDKSGRDALGAEVSLQLTNSPPLFRRVRSAASFLSARDPRLVFGLGSTSSIEEVEKIVVQWPDGETESFPPGPLRSYQTLRQGSR